MTGIFWAIAAVVIVAIVSLTELQKAKHRARHGITLDWMGQEKRAEVPDSALRQEVEELRERVKVIERIVTDDPGAKRLSAEIDALRDARKLARAEEKEGEIR